MVDVHSIRCWHSPWMERARAKSITTNGLLMTGKLAQLSMQRIDCESRLCASRTTPVCGRTDGLRGRRVTTACLCKTCSEIGGVVMCEQCYRDKEKHSSAFQYAASPKKGGDPRNRVRLKFCSIDGSTVDIFSKRCSHDSCTKYPSFNIESSRTAVYCKQHAKDGMVDVHSKRCLHDSCTKQPTSNVDGGKRSAYCEEHSKDGMVHVRDKRCSHYSCLRRPCYNTEGSKTAMYCKEHAEDSMVDVNSEQCSHDPCTKRSTFNVPGSKTAVYCKRHAEDGMVDVHSKRCTKRPVKITGIKRFIMIGKLAQLSKQRLTCESRLCASRTAPVRGRASILRGKKVSTVCLCKPCANIGGVVMCEQCYGDETKHLSAFQFATSPRKDGEPRDRTQLVFCTW